MKIYLSIILTILVSTNSFSEEKKKIKLFQMVTGSDPTDEKSRWNQKFEKSDYIYGKEPASFLVEAMPHIAQKGKVLDIAMGEGRNAVFLAKMGYNVVGVDFSETALAKARKLASQNSTKITTVNADLTNYKIKKNEYDIILNFYFLLRKLVPEIKKGLKPGGYIIFENYTVDQLKKKNSQFFEKDTLLETNELLKMFSDYKIIKYSETNIGNEAVASLVAQKPL